MHPMRLFTALILACVCCAVHAATIELKDGRRLDGTVRIDKDRMLVKGEDGKDVEVAFDAIRQATLNERPDRPAPQAQRPSAKAVERPTAKREGLRGEYFDVDFRTSKLIRIDPRIDFEFPEREPTDPAVPLDFAVRWTGQVEAADNGTHIFSVELHAHEEKCRVWVDEKLIIDRWGDRNAGYTGAVDLKADQKYSIRVEYLDERSWGRTRLYWSSPRQGRQVVPASRLTPPAGTTAPLVYVTSPTENMDFVSPGDVPLTAEATDADGRVARVEFYVDGNSVGGAEGEPWAVKWKKPTSGVHKVVARATDDGGITSTSLPVSISVAASKTDLAAPWAEVPLGRIYQKSTATSSGETFTLTNAGGELFGDRDAMQFALQKLSGDGTLVARLRSFEAPQAEDNAGAAAGLLIREHLNPGGARQAMVGLAPQVGVIFLRREHAWDERKLTEEPETTLPRWFKLTRGGKNVTAYHSTDGRKWNPLLTRRIDLPQDVYLGLVLGNPSMSTAKAVFDNVTFTAGGPSEANSVKGVVLVTGSLVAGNIQSVDDTSVKLSGRYGSVTVPTSQVARLVFRPIPVEATEQIQPGRTGAVLGNGDFLDGSVESLKDGKVRIGSVLFGVQRYSIHSDDITAILLRDAKTSAATFTVRAADGSVFRCKSLAVERGRVALVEQTDTKVTLGLNDVLDVVAGE